MSADLEGFFLLCRCLSRDTSPPSVSRLREDLCSPGIDWVELAVTANRHFVGPALYGALERKGLLDCLPEDARGFLRDLHGLNTARNEDLKRQALDVIRALNTAGIVPIILKGGVRLFEPAFGDPGGRMMGDLDVLLQESDFEKGAAVLRAAGYRWDEDRYDPEHHQLPALYRPGEVARVEVHRRLGFQRHILSPEAAVGEAVPLDVGGARALALCPTHRVVHNLLHAHCEDHNHALGFISLKEHWDLLAICERHGPAIDWDRIGREMHRHGLGRVFEDYLFTACHLLGLAVPPGWRRPVGSRLHYLRCLASMRWNVLARATKSLVSVTYPFSRYRLDSIYGGSGGPLDANVKRARYAWRLFRKHRLKIFRVIKRRRNEFREDVWRTDVSLRDGIQGS